MIVQVTTTRRTSFQKPLWMSSNVLAIDEDDENGRPPASDSHSSRQGLGNDEKIDIESQRPSPCSGNDDMASPSDPVASPSDPEPASASHSSRQGLGNDEKIDIESQRPSTGSGNDDMASSSDPMAPCSDPEVSPELDNNSNRGEALAVALLAAESSGSSPLGDSFPVIINVHSPPLPPVSERPSGGEPEEGGSRHHRDSWNYHADDNFEIEKEVAISEVEQEVALAILSPVGKLQSGLDQEQSHRAAAPHDQTAGHERQEKQHENHAAAHDQIADQTELHHQQQQPPVLPFPVIVNVDSPPSPPVSERPSGGEPEEAGSRHHALGKARDSWDYHADDSFEIEREVAISEVEQEVALPISSPVAELQSGQEKQQNFRPAAPHDQTVAHEQEENQNEDHGAAPHDQTADQIALELHHQQQQPPVLPTISRIKSDLRQKLNLSDLILPAAAEDSPEPLSEGGGPQEPLEGEVGEPSPNENESVIGDLPLLTSRRKPPRPTLYRVKTRLQDPPPMTLAVSDQLASLWSDAGTRSRRHSAIPPPVEDEGGGGGQQARFGPISSRRLSMVRQPEEELHAPSRLGHSVSRKSVSSGGGGDASATGGPPPAAAPSRLGLFSPSRLGLLSPSRMGLFSRSKANLAPPPEDEKDPLDDDAIPIYKKRKRKQRKWFVAFQWMFLASLIIVLIFAVKFRKLKAVVWRDIALWQWLALAIVVVSGRLIAGWCVLILVALIERHYILKKRVLYFVYGLRHAVKNCIWLALVIGVWKLVFKNIQEEDKTNSTNIVTRVLWCLFTTSALWMLKILAVKVAANSFHRAAYFDRVQDCLFHQYVLETLSAPRLDDPNWMTPNRGNSREEIPAPGVGRRAAEVQQENQQQQVSSGKHPESRAVFPRLEHLRSLEKLATTVEEEPTKPGQPTISLARAPSRTFLEPSPSRRNLASTSRMNLGGSAPYATPSQLHSPLGRVRRVSYTEPTPILARSSVPIGQDKLQELTSETVSAWTLKRLMKMIRKTNIATFSSILEKEVGDTIDSEVQAKAAAKQIFYNIARPGEKFLSLSDFLYFLPEEQATRAFGLFELNDAGHITKKSLMKWVVNIYKERRSLALTLSDNRTVVAKLHRVLDVLLLGIAVTICFLIMGVNTQKLLVAFSSVLLPSVFVFGNAARSTFESLIFLFVMHPYDVGDRINVDGQAMIVEEMNILNTILLSGSNEKIYYPNALLATKVISNYYRSPDQWDSIEFQIHSGTPVEQLGLLKERMTKYIEGLPQFWYPVFRIVCKDIEDSTRMKMALWIQHHLNYQESGERWQRRSNMILHMKTQLEELGIGFHLPRQEITVTGVPVLDVPAPRQATPI